MTRLAITLALALAARAHGYESACTYGANAPCEPGPGHARGRWVAEDDEHRRMWTATCAAANLPAGVSGLAGTFTLPVFTGETENGTEKTIDVAGELLPSIIPVDFKLARRLITRPGPLTIGEFTQLPDFSYSLWDWALGNETCPLDLEGGSPTDPKACHTFTTHMGPVNSSHFVPQSGAFYAHYHDLATERAQACDALATRLGADRSRFEEFVLACEREALVLEAIAHHFLQDAWSVGHMWERWGSPDPAPFRATPLAATAVAGLSGLIHGARSVLQPLELFRDGEVNDAMCAPHPAVQWSSPGQPTSAAGVGDMYLDVLEADRPEQWREFLACSVASVRQVYDMLSAPALGAAGPPDPSLRHVANPSNECFAQRATNRALRVGAGLNFTTKQGVPITVQLDPYAATFIASTLTAQVGQLLISCVHPPLTADCAVLTARLRLDLARVLFELDAWALVWPDGVQAASGALPDLLGFHPNRAYVGASPIASYVDPPLPWPGDGTNPRALALARTFHQAHAEDWCSVLDGQELAALKAHAAAATAGTDAERLAAYGACTEFARRHVYRWTPFGDTLPGPPLCALATTGTGDVASLHRFAAGDGSAEHTAAVWCTCGNGRLDAHEVCEPTAVNGDVNCPGRCVAKGHIRTYGPIDVLDDCTCKDCEKGNGVDAVDCDEPAFAGYPSCRAGDLVAYLGFPTGPNLPVGAREIFAMQPNGAGKTQLTDFCGRYLLRGLTWSPDATRLAFFGYEAGTNAAVYLFVMDADGTEVTRFETLGFGNIQGIGPSWSPDGTKMAMALGGGIYTFDLATHGFLKIATNPSATHYYDQPIWSPDGTRVAVRIHQQGVGTYNFRDDIGVVPAGGGTVTNLTANRNPDGSLGDAGCPNGGPAWSPDSTTIVFHDGQCLRPDPVTVTGWGSRLASVVVQSGALTLLTPIPPNTGTGFRNASHSPDGERLVFEYQSSSNVGSIGSLPATGGISPTLATAFGEKPTWRPAP